MSFLLCHECFSWVEPIDGRCPACQQGIDPADPDPDGQALAVQIGELTFSVAEVSLRRKKLPDMGTLWATSRGLIFIPHLVSQKAVPAANAGFATRALVHLMAMIWFPFLLLKPFLALRRAIPRLVDVYEPRRLHDEDRTPEELSRRLMSDPGVFFVPQRSIRYLSWNKKRLRIERFAAPTLTLKVLFPHSFQSGIRRLSNEELWRSVAGRGV